MLPRLIVPVFGITLFALSACSTSTSQESAAVESQSLNAEESQPAQPVLDPIVCERIAPTGTRIPTKVCKKKSEWDLIKNGGQNMGTDVQRRATHMNTTRG